MECMPMLKMYMMYNIHFYTLTTNQQLFTNLFYRIGFIPNLYLLLLFQIHCNPYCNFQKLYHFSNKFLSKLLQESMLGSSTSEHVEPILQVTNDLSRWQET